MRKKYRVHKQANGKYIVSEGTPTPSLFGGFNKIYNWQFYIVPFDTAELAEKWVKCGLPQHEVVKEWEEDE